MQFNLHLFLLLQGLYKSVLVLAFYAFFTPLSTYLGHLATSNGANGYLVEGVTMISNFVLEFIYTKFVVYRNSCNTLNSKKILNKVLIE